MSEQKSIIQKRTERTVEMIKWLSDHKSEFPNTFKLSQGITVMDKDKCIDTVISTLANYMENKNFCYAFISEYHIAYELKKYHARTWPA